MNFKNLATLIQNNNPEDDSSPMSALGIANDKEGRQEIIDALDNPDFNAKEIIDDLKKTLAESNIGTDLNGIIIDDFGSMVSAFEAAAAGSDDTSDGSFFNPTDTETRSYSR